MQLGAGQGQRGELPVFERTGLQIPRDNDSWRSTACSVDDLLAQSPPRSLRCYGSLLEYRSLLGIAILPGPRSLSSVNLAHSSGNPLSKWQVGFEFNFNGTNIQQRVGNLDLGFS